MNNHFTTSVSPEGLAVPRFILSASQQQQLADIFQLKQQQEMQQHILYENFQQQLQALKQQQQHELQVWSIEGLREQNDLIQFKFVDSSAKILVQCSRVSLKYIWLVSYHN